MSLFFDKKIREKHYIQLVLLLIIAIFYFIIGRSTTELSLFCIGYIWQWSSQFEYIQNQAKIKKYRFSFLRFYFEFISFPKKIKNYFFSEIVSLITPVIFMGLIFQIFSSPFYIQEIFMGSLFMRLLLKIPQVPKKSGNK